MTFKTRAGRVRAVNGFEFPSSVRRRFEFAHPGLDGGAVASVESAARQWFRLAARHPRARLAMPSVTVDDLWHELVLHTREYAAFCDAAFGRFLHHEPGPDDGAGGGLLRTTLGYARDDEGCGPAQLPLLFRVDGEVGATNGARYLADCGGAASAIRRRAWSACNTSAVPARRSTGRASGWTRRFPTQARSASAVAGSSDPVVRLF